MAMITTPIPDVNGAKSTDQKIEMLLDSYFQLRKEIEYGMQNVDFENLSTNFNKRLVDNFGNVTELILTSEMFSTRLTNAEGDISSISQIANAIELRVTDNEGNISILTQTSNSLSSRITDAEGDISTVIQTSNTLTSRVTTAEGNISTVTQTANSLTTRVTSAEGNITTIKQTSDAIALAVNASKLVFNANGLSVYNGGFKMFKGSTQVFYADANGDLRISGYFSGNGIEVDSNGTTLTGGKFRVINQSSIECFKIDQYGGVMSRGLYVTTGTSGSLTTSNTMLKVIAGANGEVYIGETSYTYYQFRPANSYPHTFRGKIDIGSSSDIVRIKGFNVAFDANGFLKKA